MKTLLYLLAILALPVEGSAQAVRKQRFPGVPGQRVSTHAMAYDIARRRTVMSGGYEEGCYCQTTYHTEMACEAARPYGAVRRLDQRDTAPRHMGMGR